MCPFLSAYVCQVSLSLVMLPKPKTTQKLCISQYFCAQSCDSKLLRVNTEMWY